MNITGTAECLLALDTSSDSCSLALRPKNSKEVYLQRFEVAPRKHTSLLTGMLASLLREADISLAELGGIVVSRGPSASFTGIRLAISFAQGLAYGLNLPVIPISTLAGLARQWLGEGGKAVLQYETQNRSQSTTIGVLIDGKMHSYYYGVFRFNLPALRTDKIVLEENIYDLESLRTAINRAPPQVLLGDQNSLSLLDDLPSEVQMVCISDHLQAKYLLMLADECLAQVENISERFKPELALPCYLREKRFWRVGA